MEDDQNRRQPKWKMTKILCRGHSTVGHHHDIRQKLKVKIPMIFLYICIGNGMLVQNGMKHFLKPFGPVFTAVSLKALLSGKNFELKKS